jgi:uncharacterized membrane protein YozB (DUF420 family)
MNHYLEPSGFLGTGASLASDLTLIAYLLLIIPGMLAGFYFARSGRHRPDHKWTMILITLVNFVLIIGLMMFAYRYDIAENIGSQPTNFRYLMPTIHALFGFPAQVLAFIIIINMLREDSAVAAAKKRGETDLSKYWWKRAKPVMRLTLALWLITATFGVVSYLIRYDVLSLPSSADSIQPVATEEPAPLETEEAESTATDEPEPVETEEVQPTATDEPEPVETEEIQPTATDEPEPVATEKVQPTATDEPKPATTEEATD